MCGENVHLSFHITVNKGSPPRVRGKLAPQEAQPLHLRITPACAGKTATIAIRVRESRDHPRVCGENKQIQTGDTSTTGSPPRVRGKLGNHEKSRTRSRITPACAGKTVGSTTHKGTAQDHPRVCGENLLEYELPHKF